MPVYCMQLFCAGCHNDVCRRSKAPCNPYYSTALPSIYLRGQSNLTVSSLPPKRDWGPKRVNVKSAHTHPSGWYSYVIDLLHICCASKYIFFFCSRIILPPCICLSPTLYICTMYVSKYICIYQVCLSLHRIYDVSKSLQAMWLCL